MQRRLGDMVITFRPWPTPDPKKCLFGDCIGILTRGSIDSEDGPGDLDCQQITKFFLHPHVGWYFSEGGWGRPSSLGAHLLDGAEDGSWKKWADHRGWFWVTEPAPLSWVDGTHDDTLTGAPCWRAEPGPGLRLCLIEYVVGLHETGMHAEWELVSEIETVSEVRRDVERFLDFEEAKRAAAVLARDELTRRIS